MRLNRRGVLAAAGGVAASAIVRTPSAQGSSDAVGMSEFARLWQRTPVVGLAAGQACQDVHDFLLALLWHPDAANLDAVVVEWGNWAYQGMVDAYTRGDLVKESALRKAWRDTTVSPGNTWDFPVVHRLFTAVRALNLTCQRKRPLRVLLADPPIDWAAVHTGRDVEPYLRGRDRHMADLIAREVLAKGDRCLFYAGGLHVQHRLGHDPAGAPSAGMLLDAEHPGAYEVVMAHGLYDPAKETQMEALMSSWRRPELRRLSRHGGVGARPASDIYYYLPPHRTAGLKVSDLSDHYLYLGPRRAMAGSVTDPAVYRDPDYWAELNRRNDIFGSPHDLDRLLVEADPWYFADAPTAG